MRFLLVIQNPTALLEQFDVTRFLSDLATPVDRFREAEAADVAASVDESEQIVDRIMAAEEIPPEPLGAVKCVECGCAFHPACHTCNGGGRT